MTGITLISDGEGPAVSLSDTDILLERCIVSGGSAGMKLTGPLNSPALKHCRILENRGHGVHACEGAQGVFTECEIYNNTKSGVLVRDSNSCPRFERCQIRDNNNAGVDLGGQGRVLLVECDIFNNTWNGVVAQGERAHPRFERCKIRDNKQAGVCIFGSASGDFLKCDIYSNVRSGVRVTGIAVMIHGVASPYESESCRHVADFAYASPAAKLLDDRLP